MIYTYDFLFINKILTQKDYCYFLQDNLSCSSRLAAKSMADLEWQLINVGSAPLLNNRVHTSTRDLEAASCKGVNCHKSIAFTQAPCLISISVTSMCPYEQALCNGTRPLKLKIYFNYIYLNYEIILMNVKYPLSLACTSAPCLRSNWTQRIRLKPAAKCNGVDLRPSLAWQLTLRGVRRDDNLASSPDRLDSRIY